MKKKLLIGVLALVLCLGIESRFIGQYLGENISIVEAHSGRTDKNGGHKDNKNKSGLGPYHYHCGGYPAHLHSGGACPYSGNPVSSSSSNSSTNKVAVASKPIPTVVVSNISTNMEVGENQTLDVQLKNCDSTEYSIETDNKDVVDIKEDGTLFAVGEGSAKITVKNKSASKTITIIVKAVPVKSIEITNIKEEMQLDSSEVLQVQILPENATYKEYTIESSDEAIIAVVGGKILEACGVGETDIICKAENGVESTYRVNVYEIFPEEIKTNFDDLKIEAGKQEELEVVVLPENANDKSVEISVEDEKVLLLTGNAISARVDGKTHLLIKTSNNIVKKIPVEVFHVPATDIEIEPLNIKTFGEKFYIDCDEQLIIESKVIPENATYREVEWISNNEEIVKVDNNNFEIIGTGEVVLTACASDGITKTIEIKVIDKAMIAVLTMCGLAGVTGTGIGIYKKKKNKS